jgi:hypothetical protein
MQAEATNLLAKAMHESCTMLSFQVQYAVATWTIGFSCSTNMMSVCPFPIKPMAYLATASTKRAIKTQFSYSITIELCSLLSYSIPSSI